MSSLWAVVPAAGSGRRMASEVPKQYLPVAGEALLEHTLRALLACPDVRGLVVALDPSDRRADTLASLADPRVMRTTGGAERADSVLAGLNALAEIAPGNDWVLVHDAARPCLPVADLKRLIDTAKGHEGGAILAQPCSDTIKQVDEQGRVITTLDRSTLWRAQTPQMFPLHALRDALAAAIEEGAHITDEASAMERAGYSVAVVEGPACNIKVTVPADLSIAEAYLTAQKAAPSVVTGKIES